MATDFQTYKQMNNGCNSEHVSVGVFSCKRWGRSERQVLKFLIQALWGEALFQLVKGDFPHENNIVYIFRIQWKKLCLFSKRYHLFQDPLVVFQVLICDKTKRFQMLKLILFFELPGTTVSICYFIIDFHFLFRARCCFLLCVGKTILIWVILCV